MRKKTIAASVGGILLLGCMVSPVAYGATVSNPLSNSLESFTSLTSVANGLTTNPTQNASTTNTIYPGNGTWQPDPASYGITKESNVPIRMSDGTVLMADVYRPANLSTGLAASGKFPVILTQTPYRKTGTLTTGSMSSTGGDGYYPYLIERGYINVIVDVRGTGSSEGTWQFFGPKEIHDGVELVNWCAHQLPGSDGKVGLAGDSYLGINQLLVAGSVGPNSPLKAIFPVIAANDMYRDTAFAGGIPDNEFAIPWLALRAGLDMLPSDNIANNPAQALEVEMEHGGRLASFDAPYLTNIETGGSQAYDGNWWQVRAPENYLANIVKNNIPAFMVGGWFDLFQNGEVLNYSGLQNAYDHRPVSAQMTPNQAVTGRYQLVMGPWYHLTATVGQQIQNLQLEWFDTWLKNEPTGMANTQNPLHVYQLGSGKWINTTTYPFTATKATSYYFRSGRTGTAISTNDGYLTKSKPVSSTGQDQLVWTGGSSPFSRNTEQWSMGASTYALQQAGLPPLPYTQNDETMELGGLSYTTEPFKTGTVLAGPMDATIYATSTTTNTEFVATIEDVAPNGQSYPLTSGALLGSFRATDPSRNWYENNKLIYPYHPYTKASVDAVTPGKIERFDIQVFPTFAYIAPGHRLRITITSGDTPHIAPTPAQLPGLIGGVYQVQRNQAHASHLNVPLAAPNQFKQSSVIWGPSGS